MLHAIKATALDPMALVRVQSITAPHRGIAPTNAALSPVAALHFGLTAGNRALSCAAIANASPTVITATAKGTLAVNFAPVIALRGPDHSTNDWR